MKRLRRFAFVLALLAVVLGTLGPQASASPVASEHGFVENGQDASAEQQLAERYAPIAVLKRQEEACDRDGEAYFPAPVEVVLGNPEVALMKLGEGDDPATVVMMGPTAQDLAGLDDTYYLDFPGDSRHPGCTFETDFKRFVAALGAEPTTYARIVIDAESEQLVLQYWFWYYFNDWNNTHESDWEMVQLAFDATSASEALTQEPSQIGYAQHGGGELAEWGDSKLGLDGDRLLVYPGAGSHATYYDEDIFIGWGENGTGFGCDNTTAPSDTVPLNVVLIPAEVDPASNLAWVYFEGRWGQEQSWEYNGPFGPNTGGKWNTPVEAMSNWRTSSLRVPGTKNSVGPSSTDLFCGLSAAGSRALMELGTRPYLLLSIIIGIILLVAGLFFFKRQELGEAIGVYRRHLRVFIGIGLVTIPIGIAFNAAQFLIRDNPPVDWVVKWFNDTAGARLVAVAISGGFQQAAMVLVVSPPVIQAVSDILKGETPTIRGSFRRGYRFFLPILVGMVLSIVTAGVLIVLVIGIPVAIWLAVRWQFYGQAAVIDKTETGGASLKKSMHAVRGRWWHALSDTLIFQLIAVIPGPLVGALLMLFGKTTVDFANTFSSVVFAITVPISIIGLTLAYLRYRDRPVVATAAATSPDPGAPVVSNPAGAGD